MFDYQVKKHWLFWFGPGLFSFSFFLIVFPFIFEPVLFLCFLPIVLFPLLWAFLRWKFDIIGIKNGNFYSRLGIIFIDKKMIPIEQISFISQRQNFISNLLKCSNIEIQSSAIGNNNIIKYSDIANAEEFISIINDTKNKKGN